VGKLEFLARKQNIVLPPRKAKDSENGRNVKEEKVVREEPVVGKIMRG
jgi:hypothetical protein